MIRNFITNFLIIYNNNTEKSRNKSRTQTQCLKHIALQCWFTLELIIMIKFRIYLLFIYHMDRVVSPNFVHPAQTQSFLVYLLCRCCRHAMKIKNRHPQTDTCKHLYFVNDEDRVSEFRAHYPYDIPYPWRGLWPPLKVPNKR